MSNDSSNPKKNEIDEELVAYLDGELDGEQIQRIEQRLGSDPEYRARLRKLERTWELLDELPSGEPDTGFTKSTLEMVVTQAAKSLDEKRRNPFTVPLSILTFFAIPLALFGLAFGLTRWYQNAPYARFLEDLPVIENVDLYLKAERIEFLERLAHEGMFADSPVVEAINE